MHNLDTQSSYNFLAMWSSQILRESIVIWEGVQSSLSFLTFLKFLNMPRYLSLGDLVSN
jgi:hypothetical protein